MTGRLTSYLILIGGALGLAALWYLSYLFVRRDTLRRGVPELERKAWVIVAIALPLFGFALYLFIHLLRGYLAPQPSAGPGQPRPGTVPQNPAPGGPLPNPNGQAPIPQTAWYQPAADKIQPAADKIQPAADKIQPAADKIQPAADKIQPGTRPDHDKTPPTVRASFQPLTGSHALTVTQGPSAGRQFDLARLPARIGRGPDVDIALDGDLNVSRIHAEIYTWNGELRIRDLGSMHGTQINGVPVSDQILHPGDQISVGGTTLFLRELP